MFMSEAMFAESFVSISSPSAITHDESLISMPSITVAGENGSLVALLSPSGAREHGSLASLSSPSGAKEAGSFIYMSSPAASAWINLRVTFHRPKYNCERGFGLCFAVTVGYDDSMPGGSEGSLCPVKAQLNARNQLIIQVEESALADYEGGSALANFKGKSSLALEDPFTLSNETSKALGSSAPLTIPAGEYPVSISSGIYTVVVQL